MPKPMTLILWGSIISIAGALIGGLVVAVGKYRQDIASSAKSDTILGIGMMTNEGVLKLIEQKNELEIQVNELKADLADRDIENKIKSEEIIQLNRDLLKKSDELNKFLGGSDAYPILVVSTGNSRNGKLGFTFTIKNEFEYPIYDIVIRVTDFNYIVQNSKIENNVFVIEREKHKKSLIFSKDETSIIDHSEIITSEFYHFTDGILWVQLKCRGSFVFEKIAFVTIDKTIHCGFIVYDQNGKTLKEWLGKDPTDEVKTKLREKFKIIPTKVSMTFIN
jgi:hypothetical protein